MGLPGVQTNVFNAITRIGQRLHGGGSAAAEDSACPMRAMRRTMQSLGDGGETKRREVRDQLARVFGPVAGDLHAGVRELADVPVEQLPMAGDAAAATRIRMPGPIRQFRLNVDVEADRSQLDKLTTRVTSRQQIPGEEHIHGLDVVVPESEYGPAMTNAIIGAARVMDAVALERMRPKLAAVTKDHAALLEQWTFQRDALKALMEGIGTYAATTGLLTRTKVPGMSGMQLLEALSDGRAYGKLAAAPLGIVGPMTFRGYAPKQALELADDGVELSTSLRGIVDATRARRKLGVATAPQQRQTLQGCPILSPTAGKDAETGANMIKVLADDYLDLVKRIYAHELGAASTAPRAVA